jgi:type IX secretion system PorP/SprF family membrane protein
MKKNTLLLFLLLTAVFAEAQDLHFSQVGRAALQLNPANAGNFNGDLRAGAFHRRQWASVTVPYRTSSVFCDAGLGALLPTMQGAGAGLLVHYDDAGDGLLRTLDIRMQFAYRIPVSTDSIHFIRTGIAFGFGQRSIDFTQLRFDSQFDGDRFDPGAFNGENTLFDRLTWGDIGFGAGWERIVDNSRWNAGIGLQHLNRPKQAFTEDEPRRPVLWQVQIETEQTLGNGSRIVPQLYYFRQQKFRELTLGAEWRFQPETGNSSFGLGLYHRLGDAVIPSIILYRGKFSYGISYDINTSSLRSASKGRGGPEISILYTARKIKALPQQRTICPIY